MLLLYNRLFVLYITVPMGCVFNKKRKILSFSRNTMIDRQLIFPYTQIEKWLY